MPKDRKAEQKVDMKKKTQAEIEQEMAALQYTNPQLLEVKEKLLRSFQLVLSVSNALISSKHI